MHGEGICGMDCDRPLGKSEVAKSLHVVPYDLRAVYGTLGSENHGLGAFGNDAFDFLEDYGGQHEPSPTMKQPTSFVASLLFVLAKSAFSAATPNIVLLLQHVSRWGVGLADEHRHVNSGVRWRNGHLLAEAYQAWWEKVRPAMINEA
jgi:hypothetical protein